MTKRDMMYQKIKEHGENLKKIFHLSDDSDPVKVSKSVLRLERKAHKLAEDECNGLIETEVADVEIDKILSKLSCVWMSFGRKLPHPKVPVFLNGDPRGYALKINDDYVRKHNIKIERDWGGYGIIAPDFK